MGTPENRIKAKLRKKLDALPKRYVFMPVQSGIGASTLDYLCCVNGRFIAIETKADATKRLTERQKIVKQVIEDAGGKVFVVFDDTTMDQCVAELYILARFGGDAV
jgi:uncharacterized protein involved in type VI secretion and phage assembly